MSRVCYIPRDFSAGSIELIEKANEIIADYQAQGFTLTLRQLYYQFVARAIIPNKQTEYKRLGSIINDARLAGLVDWEAIEDRTRNVNTFSAWDSPADIIKSAAASFRIDKWADQPYRVEVWIEKDALVGVVEPACTAYDVPYFACRGYTSQSEQWRAALRFARQHKNGQTPVVLHLGDHDPSGIDMTRDNRDRLELLSGGVEIEIDRLALNMSQVEQHRPPPNPAKMTDARFNGYAEKFGDKSWELDALDPRVIDRLIRAAIKKRLDAKKWKAACAAEADQRLMLEAVSDNWDDIARQL